MLDTFNSEIASSINRMDEKEIKKLGITNLQHLATKLKEYENEVVKNMMIDLKTYFLNLKVEDKLSRKLFVKRFSQVKEVVKKELDLHQKGSIIELYTVFGMIFGLAIGSGFGNVVGIGISSASGIGIGLALGAGIGSQKESRLEKEGKIY